ncbi:MAG TPA: glycosyltransferase family 2 protein [Acidimicrobiales bacterium]|nr:glycosyltransferase family 2 protein [Acidimicrobiales bacterium]
MTITLVTPTLNAERFLPEMLASVRAQEWTDIEHIVIDGGSTDATLDILQSEPGLEVVSAPDDGLYDAINQGVARAKGDLLGFVNADDLLAPGALAAVHAASVAHPGAQMICGGAEVFRSSPSGRVTLTHVNDRAAKLLREQDVIHGAALLNARFFRPELLARAGPFDTRWRRCADSDLLMRVLDANPQRAVVTDVVYLSRAHEGSLTFSGGLELALTEEKLALCAARLDETRNTPRLQRRYRRWHSWEAAYYAWRQVLSGGYGAAARALAHGLRIDPLLPVVVSAQIGQHLRMRSQHR